MSDLAAGLCSVYSLRHLILEVYLYIDSKLFYVHALFGTNGQKRCSSPTKDVKRRVALNLSCKNILFDQCVL